MQQQEEEEEDSTQGSQKEVEEQKEGAAAAATHIDTRILRDCQTSSREEEDTPIHNGEEVEQAGCGIGQRKEEEEEMMIRMSSSSNLGEKSPKEGEEKSGWDDDRTLVRVHYDWPLKNGGLWNGSKNSMAIFTIFPQMLLFLRLCSKVKSTQRPFIHLLYGSLLLLVVECQSDEWSHKSSPTFIRPLKLSGRG